MTDQPPCSAALAVGQRVWVYDINNRKGDGPIEGTVTKVGRTLVHIDHARTYGRGTQAFRLDSGHANDKYGHQWFKTDAEREIDDRRAGAVATLKAARLAPEHGCALSVEQLEAIAKVVTDG